MKIRSVEELGEAIRTRRKELHYTQAFLAEFTGFRVLILLLQAHQLRLQLLISELILTQ